MNYWKNENALPTPAVNADKRFYKHDIMATIAHLTMLNEQGYITKKDCESLQKALTQIFYEITEEKLSLSGVTDIFALIDSELFKRAGAYAEKASVARTNEERLVLVSRMYVKEIASGILEQLELLINACVNIAENQDATVLPSAVYGISAQPTSVGHVVCAYTEALVRDAESLKAVVSKANATNIYCAYGTGLRIPVDKKRVAALLGLECVACNTLDALANRDYIHEFNYAVTLIAKHIAALVKTLSDWSNCGVLSLSGLNSSPISYGKAICTLASEAYAKAAICATQSSLAISVDDCSAFLSASSLKVVDTVFAAETAVSEVLTSAFNLLSEVSFNEQEALKLATVNYSTAVDCVNYLVSKGEKPSDAYDIVGKICDYCDENNKRLDTITLDIYKQFSTLFEDDIISAMRVKNAVRLRKADGEPGDVAVRAEIRAIKRKLNKLFPQSEE